MLTVGINLGQTRFGKSLKDGGAALALDGRVVAAIAEERLSRVKMDGGFVRALPYVMSQAGASPRDVDLVVASSCCEAAPEPHQLDPVRSIGFPRVIPMPSHHLSHALSAFYLSPFDAAIVVVLDGGGNVIESKPDQVWWRWNREQATYYLAEKDAVYLLSRDFDHPYEPGFGELYRAFTYYLGLGSSRHAGKTMALAAFGDSKESEGMKLFHTQSGHIRSLVRNDPLHPIQTLVEAADYNNWGICPPRKKGEPLEKPHADLARFIQVRMEEAVVSIVGRLIQETGVSDVCLAGGVALNCVMNQAILERSGARAIFVPPAAGDLGQSIGNALYGQQLLGLSIYQKNGFVGYLGRSYHVSVESLTHQLGERGSTLRPIELDDPSHTAADLLSKGRIIGWFQGGSEFGPRALGHRSILADPRRKTVLARLNSIKSRDSFLPYAPSVTAEHAGEYFEMDSPSPYMLFAPQVRSEVRERIPAVVHVDGSARVQTVSKEDSPEFHRLISVFREITGIPVILNTSFNRESEPIVETPSDALDCFLSTDMDDLIIGNVMISKGALHYPLPSDNPVETSVHIPGAVPTSDVSTIGACVH